jgi:hypothetical protein
MLLVGLKHARLAILRCFLNNTGAITYVKNFKLKDRIVFANILREFIEGYEAWTKY